MKNIILILIAIFSLSSYGQNSMSIPELQQYIGRHYADSIIDYSFKKRNWHKVNKEKGEVIFTSDTIHFKRENGKWLNRELNFIEFDKNSKNYIYDSKYGKTHIYKDFKRITFFDLEDKKYIYHISNLNFPITLVKNAGILQTIFYDKNYMVIPNRLNAMYYATYTKDQDGKLIDYIRLYDLNGNYLMKKYKGQYISNISIAYDIIDGEQFSYDKSGNIRRKTIHVNPNKIQFIDYLYSKNSLVYDFDTKGNLIQYTEFKNGRESKLVKYNKNQEITYASNINNKYFYQGNPSAGYELTYYEEFENNNPIIGKSKDYELGKRSFVDGSYFMESKTNGGIADILDVDFDMNNNDWVIMSTFDRVASIEGAGITIGSNDDVSSFQLFLISGDKHFNHYNIYNGFNISDLKDWKYSKYIKGYNARNKLSIMKMKNKIFVSVNGVSIFQSDFTQLSSNTVGLFVDKFGNKIKFDNLIVKKLNSKIPNSFYNPKNYISTESEFKGNGSGFLVNTSGYIATNYHVIDGATEIFTEIEGKDYKCKLVAVDKENDLAIIKVIDKNNFTNYSTIASNKNETGSEVFVLGFPYALSLLGNEIKLTDGKISSQTGFQGESKTYQISAPIQPGNSGGPLFNSDGNIIGIVSSKFTGGENVGYAIKSDYLIKFLAKNNLTYDKDNTIKNISLVEKVKSLSKTTFLIKIK